MEDGRITDPHNYSFIKPGGEGDTGQITLRAEFHQGGMKVSFTGNASLTAAKLGYAHAQLVQTIFETTVQHVESLIEGGRADEALTLKSEFVAGLAESMEWLKDHPTLNR